MRKRMIAWLLCLCVTLTAAPELLLASVPAESVTAEQTTELAETELAETETIQTESTQTETPEGTEATEESTETEVTEAAETLSLYCKIRAFPCSIPLLSPVIYW